jgi:D-alanyl-D-alanine carboxypeptidase
MEKFKGSPLTDHPDLASAVGLLEHWLQYKVEEGRLPGLSAGIVYDQELIWARGFGYADVELGTPALPDTLYRIASITKLFTSVAIMQLRDAGKLKLDDPITDYLGWFKIRSRFPETPPITIRHLLTHTSGLPRDDITPMWTDSRFPDRATLIASLLDREMALLPDTRWKYSNLAFALLGEIVSTVSGEDYADYIHNYILKPLGMDSTTVRTNDARVPRLATGYTRLDSSGARTLAPFTDSQGYAPAFNMASTVEDLARFISAQFGGEHSFLKASTIKEMHRPQWISDDWTWGNGLGFALRRYNGRTLVGHGGSVKGHNTGIEFCVPEKCGFIVLTNATSTNPQQYISGMVDIIAPVLAKTLSKPAAPPEFDAAWHKYIGKYVTDWGDFVICNEGGCLVMRTLQFPTVPPGILHPEGEHTFRMEKGGYDGELVTFEMDDEGRVQRMRFAGEYSFPAERNGN